MINHAISGSRSPSLRTYISKSCLGDRAFIYCGAKLWNAHPTEIRECPFGINVSEWAVLLVLENVLKTIHAHFRGRRYIFKISYVFIH